MLFQYWSILLLLPRLYCWFIISLRKEKYAPQGVHYYYYYCCWDGGRWWSRPTEGIWTDDWDWLDIVSGVIVFGVFADRQQQQQQRYFIFKGSPVTQSVPLIDRLQKGDGVENAPVIEKRHIKITILRSCWGEIQRLRGCDERCRNSIIGEIKNISFSQANWSPQGPYLYSIRVFFAFKGGFRMIQWNLYMQWIANPLHVVP